MQPAGAEVLAAESTTWYGATPWPTTAPGRAAARRSIGRDYRYFEERIHVHEQVYALGGFRSVSGTDRGGTEDAVRALLAEWKQDQAALTRRFDRDADGSVSLEEWERRGPRHAAASSDNAPSGLPRTALHVLGRPDDGPAVPARDASGQRDVARRYRRRAYARLRRVLRRRVRARLADAGRLAECLE